VTTTLQREADSGHDRQKSSRTTESRRSLIAGPSSSVDGMLERLSRILQARSPYSAMMLLRSTSTSRRFQRSVRNSTIGFRRHSESENNKKHKSANNVDCEQLNNRKHKRRELTSPNQPHLSGPPPLTPIRNQRHQNQNQNQNQSTPTHSHPLLHQYLRVRINISPTPMNQPSRIQTPETRLSDRRDPLQRTDRYCMSH